MKRIISLIVLLAVVILTVSCSSPQQNMVSSVPSLIKEGFVAKDSYEIVCMGFAKEGLQGIQKDASAKRAALLNAYYYTRSRFDDTVSPDMDGRIRKIEKNSDHVVIYYIIKKRNLKKRLKK